jgi:ATP-dependent Lon protease
MADHDAPSPAGPPAALAADALRWNCAPETFPAAGSADVPTLGETMGQERALSALQLGLELYAPGYNTFVSGLTGTGRTTTVKRILEEIQPHCALAPDRAYVFNFSEPDEPRLLTLPRGTARTFREEMQALVELCRKTIPGIFEDDGYQTERNAIVERYAGAERERVKKMSEAAKEDGLAIVQVQLGPMTQPEVVPLYDGAPKSFEDLEPMVAAGEITEAQITELREKQKARRAELDRHLKWAREWARRMTDELEALGRDRVSNAVAGTIEDMRARFPHQAVAEYLDGVQAHLLDNVERFLPEPPVPNLPGRQRREDQLLEYEVNVIQDQSERAGCPTIVETVPSFTNLFGLIEREVAPNGKTYSDHTKIRGGALLRADGGYLVVNATDVVVEPGVWVALKRTLKSGELNIRPPDSVFPFGPSGLKPQPIPINVKVIMIGDEGIYHRFAAAEPEFRKIFKVLAEFESDVPRTAENLSRFAQVVGNLARQDNLANVSREGLAAMAEYAVRRAGRRNRLSVRYSDIADLLRESDYWRRRTTGGERIGEAEVRAAIAQQRYRHGRYEERLKDQVLEGVIRVECTGTAVGQVNGLAVLAVGSYAWGKPSRISATTAPGRHGVINIERESNLSGTSHDKGVLILSGYLRSTFAQRFPLALTASIAFEQSYGGVDGDSASSTEMYALLSSLSGVPIRQGLAVTGSVDQSGRVQAIGGVNEKIEGFFDLCNDRGLTGDQGVLIPDSNVEDLMLRPDVVEACEAGRFHVYPVETIDAGIALLTGLPVAEIHTKVQARLEAFAGTVRDFAGPAPD